MTRFQRTAATAFLAAIAGSALAAPENWTALFSNIAGDPTADVPGNPGLTFEPSTTSSSQLDRVYASPNGAWAIIAEVTDGIDSEESLITGNGSTLQLLVQGGVPSPWNASEAPGFFNDRIGINDAGQVVFVNNTDGPIDLDEVVVSFDGSTFTVEAREGDLIGAGPEAWDINMHSPSITADGRVGFVGESLDFSAFDAGLFFDGSFILTQGEPISGAADNYDNFDDDDVYFTNAGGFITQGDSDAGSNDDFLSINGNIVLREGEIIPGSGFAEPIDTSGIVTIAASSAGDWIARGNNDATEQDWLVYNGAVVATTGDAVPGTSDENYTDASFSDTFFTMAVNGVGDYVFGATTDAADDAANAVIVHSSAGVVAREGDPIDLDGNGLFDDDVFFDVFGNEDAALTDTGELFIVARVRSGASTSLGQALVYIQIPTLACSPADLSSVSNPGVPDGVLTGADFFEFLSRFQAGDLSIDFSSAANPGVPDGVLTGADFFEFLNLFSTGC